jgi:tetratricopeptide (TPR) repeat protein
MKRLLFLAGVMLLITCSSLLGQTDEKKHIIEVLEAETKAYLAADFDAWQQLWIHDDQAMTLVPFANIQLLSWEEIARFAQEERFHENAEHSGETFHNTNYQIRILGDVAYATFEQQYYDWQLEKNRRNLEFRVLQKIDGDWKLRVVYAAQKYQANDLYVRHSLRPPLLALMEMERWDQSLSLLETYTGMYPEDPWFSNQQGWIHLQQGNHRHAKRHFEHSLNLDPNNVFAKNMMAQIGQR